MLHSHWVLALLKGERDGFADRIATYRILDGISGLYILPDHSTYISMKDIAKYQVYIRTLTVAVGITKK